MYTILLCCYLEQIEYNEYLGILEKGFKIIAAKVKSSVISVDTSDDLEYVSREMISDPYFVKGY